jgi:hypothetical protein
MAPGCAAAAAARCRAAPQTHAARRVAPLAAARHAAPRQHSAGFGVPCRLRCAARAPPRPPARTHTCSLCNPDAAPRVRVAAAPACSRVPSRTPPRPPRRRRRRRRLLRRRRGRAATPPSQAPPSRLASRSLCFRAPSPAPPSRRWRRRRCPSRRPSPTAAPRCWSFTRTGVRCGHMRRLDASRPARAPPCQRVPPHTRRAAPRAGVPRDGAERDGRGAVAEGPHQLRHAQRGQRKGTHTRACDRHTTPPLLRMHTHVNTTTTLTLRLPGLAVGA